VTLLRGIIGPDGATVRVEVGVGRTARQALLTSHRPIPQPITVAALVDTGADISCIDPRALARIALQRRRAFLRVNAPGTRSRQYQPAYFGSLTILHPSGRAADHLLVPNILLADVSLGMPACELLLGRDTLAYCRLDYDGRAATFALEY
jgi:hypothetical protein